MKCREQRKGREKGERDGQNEEEAWRQRKVVRGWGAESKRKREMLR